MKILKETKGDLLIADWHHLSLSYQSVIDRNCLLLLLLFRFLFVVVVVVVVIVVIAAAVNHDGLL